MKTARFGALAAAIALPCLWQSPAAAQAQSLAPETFVLQPDPASALSTPAPALSANARDALLSRIEERRETSARDAAERFAREAATSTGQTDVQADLTPAVPETRIGAAESVTSTAAGARRAPGTFRITRNNKNTRAEVAGNSALASPVAINNRNQVLYAGNFAHLEFSTNHGATYSDRVFPAGPADAPTPCCSPDMVIDDASGVGFVSMLYTNAAVTNGMVRIFVRPAGALGATSCSYTVDPAGASNNILPDSPRIALTRNNFFLSVNALPTAGSGFARMYRIPLSQIRSCTALSVNSITVSHSVRGQRVWTPAEGANQRTGMYWLEHEDADTVGIYRWTDGATAAARFQRNISASNFTNPDCRGGTGNFDFIEQGTSWSIAGFRTRCTVAQGANQPNGVLACYWNSNRIGNQSQGHVRSAVWRLSDMTLVAQPHLYSNAQCFGYPAVTGNSLGDIGISVAFGGRLGGGGTAVRAGVGIDDQYTAGTGVFGTIFPTANGVANRADGRFGDRFSIHPYQTCDRWFAATNYAWDSAPVDNAADVNARWVEFGREANIACYNAAL